MENILFLSPIYLITIIVVAIVIGLFHSFSKRDALTAFSLFSLFSIGQLVFRILLDAQPERLVGQLIYFGLFTLIIYLVKRFKS